MFADRIFLDLCAGNGGDGVIRWLKEPYRPRGGPCGGDGGHGGSVFLEADHNLCSLDHLRNCRVICAGNGGDGGSQNKKGRSGGDRAVKVPVGTIVRDGTSEVDLLGCRGRVIVCRGGHGGRGNRRFVSSTCRVPRVRTMGTAGERKRVELELKLIADVGLVGLPNAGKTKLLSYMASIKLKSGGYPFTTLTPQLGSVVSNGDVKICVADIPGIIKGAHKNKGLGLSFLRHIERCSALLYVIDVSGEEGRDPYDDWMVLRDELGKYSKNLLKKRFLIALNKVDKDINELNATSFKDRIVVDKNSIIETSSLTGIGMDQLIAKASLVAS